MLKYLRLLACLLLSTAPALMAQTDLGTANIGSSTTASVNATILHSGILASITVTTGGNASLDFTGGPGTCALASPVTAGATCTIQVTFTPTLAGQRFGGFLLLNQDGSIAAQGYLHGIGLGPQITYMPGTKSQLLTNVIVPNGLATDLAGNAYAVEGASISNPNALVVKLPADKAATAPLTVQDPTSVSVDGAGNTYLVDNIDWISVLLPNGTYITANSPQPNMSTDAAGNLYKNCAIGLCKETLQSDGSYIESTVTSDGNLTVYYVDPSGDVFATENDGRLYEFEPTAGGSYTSISGSNNGKSVSALSADGLGNIYGIDSNGNAYKEAPLSNDSAAMETFLFNGALVGSSNGGGSNRLAADSAGNLYYWASTGTAGSGNTTYPVYGLFEQNYTKPSTFFFAPTEQLATSAPQTVTISNSGNLPLQFSSIAFPADFKQVTSSGACTEGTSLETNTSCTLTFEFAPVASVSSPATVTEHLLITTNLHNAPGTQQAITLTGTETPATTPTIVFTPTSLVFPTTFPGSTSAPLVLTVTNTGNTAATVTTYRITGPNASEFSLLGKTCGYTLAAHSKCILSYLFKPTAAGPATATLIATNNAYGAPQSIPIKGTGTEPAALAFSAGLIFPSTKANAASVAQNITVSNTSTLPMKIDSFSLAGANPSQFTIVGKTCTTTLAAKASCIVAVEFRPTQPGPAAATLVTIAYANGSPGAVSLSGTGK